MTTVLGLPQWLWVVLALAAVAVVAYYVREFVRQRKARLAIDNVISSVAYDELRNVLVPTGTGEQIHVNYLLLTQRGLLVIDLFDVPGIIFAGEKMEQWSVFGSKRHFTFTNPLPMLEDRVAAVRHLAGDVPVEGRVVFSMRGEFPKGRPAAVLRLDALQDEFPVVERGPGAAAAAFASVWEHVRGAAQPNPLAS
ncbi:MAG TPA: NERD domain-containing protein [Steroidobacteraceae bacterium]|nr:NERD domain-containing protein [Steroidobacteraceae bacterium]